MNADPKITLDWFVSQSSMCNGPTDRWGPFNFFLGLQEWAQSVRLSVADAVLEYQVWNKNRNRPISSYPYSSQ